LLGQRSHFLDADDICCRFTQNSRERILRARAKSVHVPGYDSHSSQLASSNDPERSRDHSAIRREQTTQRERDEVPRAADLAIATTIAAASNPVTT
jgi:hypothetical protein